MQNARAALMIQVLLNGMNIVLDLWFVVGLGLGVAGVAKATLIAKIMGVTFDLWLVHRHCTAAKRAMEPRQNALE